MRLNKFSVPEVLSPAFLLYDSLSRMSSFWNELEMATLSSQNKNKSYRIVMSVSDNHLLSVWRIDLSIQCNSETWSVIKLKIVSWERLIYGRMLLRHFGLSLFLLYTLKIFLNTSLVSPDMNFYRRTLQNKKNNIKIQFLAIYASHQIIYRELFLRLMISKNLKRKNEQKWYLHSVLE